MIDNRGTPKALAAPQNGDQEQPVGQPARWIAQMYAPTLAVLVAQVQYLAYLHAEAVWRLGMERLAHEVNLSVLDEMSSTVQDITSDRRPDSEGLDGRKEVLIVDDHTCENGEAHYMLRRDSVGDPTGRVRFSLADRPHARAYDLELYPHADRPWITKVSVWCVGLSDLVRTINAHGYTLPESANILFVDRHSGC